MKNNTHMQRLQKPDLISLVDLILDGHYKKASASAAHSLCT